MIAGVKRILKEIKKKYVIGELNKKWRDSNPNNFTTLKSDCDISNIIVGDYTYGELDVRTFGSEHKLNIGHFCSIADNVVFLLAGNHALEYLSTYPFNKMVLNGCAESLSKGNINIGDDVWIGMGATILSGVNIGQGSVVAAKSVVVKDVPPYAVVAGVPAKVVKMRFEEEVIDKLMLIDWKKIDRNFISANSERFYEKVNNGNVEELLSILPQNNGWLE